MFLSEKGKVMNDAHERAGFEAWARKHGQPVFRDDEEPGCYAYSNVQDNWIGWQARAALQSPAVQGELVGWQFYQDGKWWHGDDRIKDHRKNTEEAGFRVRDVYADPQSVEQQPSPDAAALVEALEMARRPQQQYRQCPIADRVRHRKPAQLTCRNRRRNGGQGMSDFPIIVAFFAGLLTGFMFWGGRKP